MFWKKKPKKVKSNRDAAIAQAKEAMAVKRAEIGDEALAEIKEVLFKKQNSLLEKSKKQILSADQDKVRDNINFWLRE